MLPPYELNRGVSVDRVYTTKFGRASLPERTLDYLSFYITASLRLLRLARSADVIVAKTHPPLISVPAGWVASVRRARLVNWMQDVFPEVAAELGVAGGRGVAGKASAGSAMRRYAWRMQMSRSVRSWPIASSRRGLPATGSASFRTGQMARPCCR